MKTKELQKIINSALSYRDIPKVKVSHGGKHDKWHIGEFIVIVPRHLEISDGTVNSIVKSLEPMLGKGWWRDVGN